MHHRHLILFCLPATAGFVTAITSIPMLLCPFHRPQNCSTGPHFQFARS